MMSTPQQRGVETRRRRQLLAGLPTLDRLRRLDRSTLAQLDGEDRVVQRRRERRRWREIARLNDEARAEGFPSDGDFAPWYLKRLHDRAVRAGDADILLTLERFTEVSRAISEAQAERDQLRETLRIWEEETDLIEGVRQGRRLSRWMLFWQT